MNKRIVQIILCSLILFTIQSCNDNVNSTSNESLIEIVPLKIGNSWTKVVTEYDTSGAIKSIDTVTVVVLRDTMINNVRWYITNEGIFRNDENGFWEYWYSNPIIACKYPTAVSDTINVTNYTTVTVETNVEVTTTIGKTNCYHYLRTTVFDQNVRMHFYISPGIGNVLEVVKRIVGNKELISNRTELISYNVQ